MASSASDTAAIVLLHRAVELDSKKMKMEAYTCYLEGIQLLMNVIKEMKTADTAESDSRLAAYRAKTSECMKRAEQLKMEIEEEKQRQGEFHEQVRLEGGSTGHSYQSLFGRFLDENVTQVSCLFEIPHFLYRMPLTSSLSLYHFSQKHRVYKYPHMFHVIITKHWCYL